MVRKLMALIKKTNLKKACVALMKKQYKIVKYFLYPNNLQLQQFVPLKRNFIKE